MKTGTGQIFKSLSRFLLPGPRPKK